MRLVNADEIVKMYENVIQHGIADEDGDHVVTAETVLFEVNRLPTIDAVPVKHGRWIWRNYPGYQYQCDQCERWAMFESKFCPNCGALMDWWKDGDHETD